MKKRRIWLLVMFLCVVLAVQAWSFSELQFKKQLPYTPKESLTPEVSSTVPLERVPVKSKPTSLTGGELELLGIAMTNSKDPLAFIRDLKTQKQGVYKLGSLIKGAKIVGIARGKVLLEKNGQREILGLTSKVKSGSKPDLAIVTVSENQMRVNKTAALNEVVNQYDTLKNLKIKPYYVSAQVKGLMVEGIAKGSIIEAAGIRNKDIINTVNNQKLDSYQKALEVARKVRNQSEIKVNLVRDGAIRTLTYQLGQ